MYRVMPLKIGEHNSRTFPWSVGCVQCFATVTCVDDEIPIIMQNHIVADWRSSLQNIYLVCWMYLLHNHCHRRWRWNTQKYTGLSQWGLDNITPLDLPCPLDVFTVLPLPDVLIMKYPESYCVMLLKICRVMPLKIGEHNTRTFPWSIGCVECFSIVRNADNEIPRIIQGHAFQIWRS